jgi:hypothetical protein
VSEDFTSIFSSAAASQAPPPKKPRDSDHLLPQWVDHFFTHRTYKSQSDEYSKVAATGFQADLLHACPLYRTRTEEGKLCHEVNGCISEFPAREEWDGHRWDFVAGTAATRSWKPSEDRSTPRERLRKHYIDLPDRPELKRFYDRLEGAVHRAHIAVEIKASVKKANPTVRMSEFAISNRWAHEFDPKILAVAILFLEVSDPAQAQVTANTLLKLKRREAYGDVGLDALLLIPFGPRYDELKLPEDVQYGPALASLARRYENYWP